MIFTSIFAAGSKPDLLHGRHRTPYLHKPPSPDQRMTSHRPTIFSLETSVMNESYDTLSRPVAVCYAAVCVTILLFCFLLFQSFVLASGRGSAFSVLFGLFQLSVALLICFGAISAILFLLIPDSLIRTYTALGISGMLFSLSSLTSTGRPFWVKMFSVYQFEQVALSFFLTVLLVYTTLCLGRVAKLSGLEEMATRARRIAIGGIAILIISLFGGLDVFFFPFFLVLGVAYAFLVYRLHKALLGTQQKAPIE